MRRHRRALLAALTERPGSLDRELAIKLDWSCATVARRAGSARRAGLLEDRYYSDQMMIYGETRARMAAALETSPRQLPGRGDVDRRWFATVKGVHWLCEAQATDTAAARE